MYGARQHAGQNGRNQARSAAAVSIVPAPMPRPPLLTKSEASWEIVPPTMSSAPRFAALKEILLLRDLPMPALGFFIGFIDIQGGGLALAQT